MPEPTIRDIEELVAFLPKLDAPGLAPVERWGGGKDTQTGVVVFPWPVYAQVVEDFAEAASKECWTDYAYLPRDVNRMLAEEDGLANLGLHEIKSVLTFFIRGERFCSGHWEAMIEAGHVRRVLKRLEVLGAEVAKGGAA